MKSDGIVRFSPFTASLARHPLQSHTYGEPELSSIEDPAGAVDFGQADGTACGWLCVC